METTAGGFVATVRAASVSFFSFAGVFSASRSPEIRIAPERAAPTSGEASRSGKPSGEALSRGNRVSRRGSVSVSRFTGDASRTGVDETWASVGERAESSDRLDSRDGTSRPSRGVAPNDPRRPDAERALFARFAARARPGTEGVRGDAEPPSSFPSASAPSSRSRFFPEDARFSRGVSFALSSPPSPPLSASASRAAASEGAIAAPATAALHAMLQYRDASLWSVRLHRRQLDLRPSPRADEDAFASPVPPGRLPRGCGRGLRNTTRAPLMTYVWIARASKSRHTSRTRTTLW